MTDGPEPILPHATSYASGRAPARPAGRRHDTQEVVTPAQVAALLQIHVKTVYRLARRGTLPGRQIGRRWRFSRTEILALVSNQWAAPDLDADAPTQKIEPPLNGR